jgi:hypothetical protein
MSSKGAMIELQLAPDRIAQLAPLYPHTPLTRPGHEAFIAAPLTGAWGELAEQLQQQLAALTGHQPRLVAESELYNPRQLAAPGIALGHAGNNRLLRSLHYQGWLGAADYPDEGLRVQSVHNPCGDGHNVLCALGATVAAARRGSERLVQSVCNEAGQWQVSAPLGLREPAPVTDDPAQWLPRLQQLDRSATGHPLLLHPLRQAASSGEERWARAFIEALRPYADGSVPLSFAKMNAVDFWTRPLVLQWMTIEEFPFFSDEERLMVVNFIVACAQYCHDSITYQKWRISDDDHQIFNHHTFPAGGLFFACRYLQRHGYELAEVSAWLDKSLRVFARAATAGRSFDEGGAGYSWLVGQHLLEVAFSLGDTSYAASDKMVSYADLATVIQNNAFEMVPFGDCHGYHSRDPLAAEILLLAAEYHRHPGYKWLAQQYAPEKARANVFTRELPAEPLTEHVGLFVLPLDPVIHRWAGIPAFPGYPVPAAVPTVPPEQGFDKLSLRGGWGARDDYLLLQGFGSGQHGHPDANAISQYQAQGRLFLVDCDYILRMPAQHNMVMVIRDGRHDTIPITARLDNTVEFATGALTQTTLPGYNGCDWQRTLLWLRNDCVLVVDTLTALVGGDYELRCYWRTLAETQLTDRGLHTVHEGEHFHVIEVTDSARRLDTEPPGVDTLNYIKYNYGSGAPQVLRETQRVRLETGEQACFVNLLLPNRQSAEPRRQVQMSEGRVLVTGEGPVVVLCADGVEVEGAGNYVFAAHERLTGLQAQPRPMAATPAPAVGELMGVSEKWHLELPAKVTALAALAAGRLLVGDEGGSCGLVDETGQLVTLLQTEGKIGAVMAARLWGEADETYMVAAYDSTLRLLWPDGSSRFVVPLPRNTHLPAHGRALTVANLEGDGRLWPVVGTDSWRVHAVTPQGTLRWTFDSAAHSITALTAGDLNHDGCDEVVAATVYYCIPAITAAGERLWEDEDYNDYWAAGPLFPFVEIADIDGDGDLEVITCGSDTLVHCIDRWGVKKWTCSVGDEARGLVLVPGGVVAAAATGEVHLVDGQGRPGWRYSDEVPCQAAVRQGELIVVAREDGRLEWLNQQGQLVARTRLGTKATRLQPLSDSLLIAASGTRLQALQIG